MRWQFYALATLLVWGLWGFLPKLALRSMDARSALILQGLGDLLVALPVVIAGGWRVHARTGDLLAAIATGICGLGGAYFFLLAMQRGKASIVVPFTSLYPLITLILSVLFLRERVSLANLAGAALGIAAVVLLSVSQ